MLLHALENCSRPAIFILLLLEMGEGPGPGEPVQEQGISVLEATELERSLDCKGQREDSPGEGFAGYQERRAGSPVGKKRGLKPDCRA